MIEFVKKLMKAFHPNTSRCRNLPQLVHRKPGKCLKEHQLRIGFKNTMTILRIEESMRLDIDSLILEMTFQWSVLKTQSKTQSNLCFWSRWAWSWAARMNFLAAPLELIPDLVGKLIIIICSAELSDPMPLLLKSSWPMSSEKVSIMLLLMISTTWDKPSTPLRS